MEFTKEQLLFRDTVARFAREQVAPLAAEIDQKERFPQETFSKMAEWGLLGIGLPEEYGGSGGGMVESCIVAEELARHCGSTAATQIFGGYGYIRGFPVERFLRDARIMTIGGGTSEIMCQIISRELAAGIEGKR